MAVKAMAGAWLFEKSPVLGWSAHFHWTQTKFLPRCSQGPTRHQTGIEIGEDSKHKVHFGVTLKHGVKSADTATVM